MNVIRVEIGSHDDIDGIDLYTEDVEKNKVSWQYKANEQGHQTGNLTAEVISQAYHNRPSIIGCDFKPCKAEWIAHDIIEERHGYIFKTSEWLEYIINNYEHFKGFGANQKTAEYRTLGLLIPYKETEKNKYNYNKAPKIFESIRFWEFSYHT